MRKKQREGNIGKRINRRTDKQKQEEKRDVSEWKKDEENGLRRAWKGKNIRKKKQREDNIGM